MSIPGYSGWSVLSDKSLSFYQNPVKFTKDQMTKFSSKIFISKILNKSTVFVCDYNLAKDLLKIENSQMEMGYKEYWHKLFGNCVIFTEGEEAEQSRQYFQELLSQCCNSREKFHIRINSIIRESMANIPKDREVNVYSCMKDLCLRITLSTFFDIEPFQYQDMMQCEESKLTHQHWHGITSLPLSVKAPLFGDTGYKKSLNAKERLEAKLRCRLAQLNVSFKSTEKGVANLLLLTSALIPKAMASLLTSAIIQFTNYPPSQEQKSDPHWLDAALLEVFRLWPPFFGGRRLTRDGIRLMNLTVPPNHAVIYVTALCHLDEEHFPHPEQFAPDRWMDYLKSGRSPTEIVKSELFTLGSGSRDCLGHDMTWFTVKHAVQYILANRVLFSESLIRPDSMKYKYLPVLRPKDPIAIQFLPPCPPFPRDDDVSTELLSPSSSNLSMVSATSHQERGDTHSTVQSDVTKVVEDEAEEATEEIQDDLFVDANSSPQHSPSS